MKGIREYALKDLKLKALSVILATMLWFAISYLGESQMTVSIQAGTRNLSRDYIITGIDTRDILVTVSGTASVLKNIRGRDIRVSLDLSTAKDGRHSFNLHKGNVEVPKGVKVEGVKPDYIVVDVDKALEKRLKVIVKLDDRWAGIYKVKSWSPAYVLVEGSQESLAERTTIDTLPVDNHMRNEEEEVYVGLDTNDMIVGKIRPDSVRVVVRK